MTVVTTGHPRAQCVDLRATFAGRFRFGYEESYQAERPDLRKAEAAWLTIIPCRVGARIFPWGGRTLAAYCTAAKARTLDQIPGVAMVQGGPRCPEATLTFDVDLLDRVADVLGARRPRHLSDEQRAVCSARLRVFAAARREARGPNVRRAPASRDSTIGAPDVFADVDRGTGLEMQPVAAAERREPAAFRAVNVSSEAGR